MANGQGHNDERSAEEESLADLGAELFDQVTRVEVRLSQTAAAAASAAWARNDDHAIAPDESIEDRHTRHRAGSLALIGWAIKESGKITGDYVTVELDAREIGVALEAADDLGRLE